MRTGVEPVPQRWKENIPFLMLFLVIFISSAVLKYGIYFGKIDFNTVVKSKSKKRIRKVDWHNMLQDTISLLLSTLLGIYSDPILGTLAGEKDVCFPYPIIGPLLILSCIFLKFWAIKKMVRTVRKK